MPNLEPIRAYKCTYKDCPASFNSVKDMVRHKKNSDLHDYCHKCDEDFDSVDDLAQHKAWRPDKHEKACRICGDEFKSVSGLRRHIELTHRTNQKVVCIGCGDDFYNATQFIGHLEFGHCSVIQPAQFLGHIIHKHVIHELLKGGEVFDRFVAKVSKFNAAIDDDDGDGGITIDSELITKAFEDGDQARKISYKAMQPEGTDAGTEDIKQDMDQIPSQHTGAITTCESNISAAFKTMSLSGGSQSSMPVGSGKDTSSKSFTDGTLKAWGGSSSKMLFPDAQPTPPPGQLAVGHPAQEVEHVRGINLLDTRFWDPASGDWNAERFFNPITKTFSCPFPCEQTFTNKALLSEHIIEEHRLQRINCPRCLKYYSSITGLMQHIDTPGSTCVISKATDFNMILDRITGGFLTVKEVIRPEFLHNPTVRVFNPETGKKEEYTPPTATMLEYKAAIPSDWKPPRAVAAHFGGDPQETFSHKGQQSHW